MNESDEQRLLESLGVMRKPTVTEYVFAGVVSFAWFCGRYALIGYLVHYGWSKLG